MVKFCILYLLLWSSFVFAYENVDYVPNEVIVKLKGERSSFINLGKLASNNQLSLKKSWSKFNLHKFSMKTGERIEDVLANLKNDPDVEFAEPNFYFYSNAMPYGMTSAKINVPESWKILSEPKSIEELPVIAIVDSGLDLSHSVFNSTDRVFINLNEIPDNGYDDDGNGYIDDVSGWNFVGNNSEVIDDAGHGTHVSGIALGSTENVIDFNASNSPRVQILPLKFLNSEGVGKTSDAVEAIQYAIKMGAKVINTSWGGTNYSASLHSALNSAYEHGIIIVAAAGNDSHNNDEIPVYPASLDVPSLISVGATTSNDNYASFSNFGVETVDVTSPGVGILSTIPGNTYGVSSGTSMAAPFISGLAALMFAEAPNLSGYQIKQIIMDMGDEKVALSNYVLSGRRINFLSSVDDVKTLTTAEYYQPDYSPLYSKGTRSTASSSFGESLGCARVKEFYQEQNGNFNTSKKTSLNLPLNMIFFLLPLLMLLNFRYRAVKADKRNNGRKKVNISGQIITSTGDIHSVRIVDLSITGAGIQVLEHHSTERFEKATDLIMNLVLDKQTNFRLKAKIIRITKNGFLGVQFN